MSIRDSFIKTYDCFLSRINSSDNYLVLVGGSTKSVAHIAKTGEMWIDKLFVKVLTKHIKDLTTLQNILQIESVLCFEYFDKHVIVKNTRAREFVIRKFLNPDNVKEGDKLIAEEYTLIDKEVCIEIKGGSYTCETQSIDNQQRKAT